MNQLALPAQDAAQLDALRDGLTSLQRLSASAFSLAGLGGTELSRALGNANGGLPYTVVFDARGQVAHRKIGQVYPEDLAGWL